MKVKYSLATAFIFFGILKAQVVTQLGVWNNNANFRIKYHQNKLITSTTGGITFLDVSNPSNPSSSASLGNPAFFPMAIEIDNNYAYFGGGMTGYFMIANISNLNFPTQTGITYKTFGTGYQIAIKGNYAFMPTNLDTLYVIDVSNKNSPTVVNKLHMVSPFGIAIKGNYAFVGSANGLKVVDVTNPLSISVVSSFGGGYGKISADVINNRLFVAKSGQGFDVIDITNPTSPAGLFQGIGGNSSGDLVYKNGYLFQIGSNNVSVFQISNTSSTYLSSFNNTSNSQVVSVDVKDSTFYLSTVNNVHVLKLGALTTKLIGHTSSSNEKNVFYPNPAKYDITIQDEFITPQSKLCICNSTGQSIKQITNFSLNENKINIAELNSGLYFISITTNQIEKRIPFCKE